MIRDVNFVPDDFSTEQNREIWPLFYIQKSKVTKNPSAIVKPHVQQRLKGGVAPAKRSNVKSRASGPTSGGTTAVADTLFRLRPNMTSVSTSTSASTDASNICTDCSLIAELHSFTNVLRDLERKPKRVSRLHVPRRRLHVAVATKPQTGNSLVTSSSPSYKQAVIIDAAPKPKSAKLLRYARRKCTYMVPRRAYSLPNVSLLTSLRCDTTLEHRPCPAGNQSSPLLTRPLATVGDTSRRDDSEETKCRSFTKGARQRALLDVGDASRNCALADFRREAGGNLESSPPRPAWWQNRSSYLDFDFLLDPACRYSHRLINVQQSHHRREDENEDEDNTFTRVAASTGDDLHRYPHCHHHSRTAVASVIPAIKQLGSSRSERNEMVVASVAVAHPLFLLNVPFDQVVPETAHKQQDEGSSVKVVLRRPANIAAEVSLKLPFRGTVVEPEIDPAKLTDCCRLCDFAFTFPLIRTTVGTSDDVFGLRLMSEGGTKTLVHRRQENATHRQADNGEAWRRALRHDTFLCS
ncbi:unnamed protein product [Soboliphyme baturini]|uniref:Protein kinase domain-containing protein n=1 Tax=Soboliphyme baturini TaxID=241478 RepID=A0A183IN27_9BILA|nr:unnamed protein product [Soboliphyme baturini]